MSDHATHARRRKRAGRPDRRRRPGQRPGPREEPRPGRRARPPGGRERRGRAEIPVHPIASRGERHRRQPGRGVCCRARAGRAPRRRQTRPVSRLGSARHPGCEECPPAGQVVSLAGGEPAGHRDAGEQAAVLRVAGGDGRRASRDAVSPDPGRVRGGRFAQIGYPVLIKPEISPLFARKFQKKGLVAHEPGGIVPAPGDAPAVGARHDGPGDHSREPRTACTAAPGFAPPIPSSSSATGGSGSSPKGSAAGRCSKAFSRLWARRGCSSISIGWATRGSSTPSSNAIRATAFTR